MFGAKIQRGLVCTPHLLIAFFAVACGEADADFGMETETEDGMDIASASQELNTPTSGWATWPSRLIRVCWRSTEFTNAGLADFRTRVRFTVEQNIGRLSDLRFWDWGQCPTADNAAMIEMQQDTSTATSYGGKRDDNSNFGYHGNKKSIVRWGTKNGAASISQGLILHEFMHALGFDHEFNRPQNATAQQCGWEGNHPGNDYGTPYDSDSILNFSNPALCAGPRNVLSPWDVVGLQRAYGHKPYLSIVGTSNKCLDIDNPSGTPPMSATRFQMWECLDNANQALFFNQSTSPTSWTVGAILHAFSGGSNVWMDVQWGNSANGTPVWNWTFNNSAPQQWKLDGVNIVGMGDLCLDVTGANFSAGAGVQMWTCNGFAQQKWDIFLNPVNNGTYIRPTAAPHLCLTRTGATGVSLQLCDYGSSPAPDSQTFMNVWGHIQNGSPTKCLDVLWATPTNGQQVQFIDCRATDGSDQLNDAQRFYFRGRIKGLAGKCLDVNAPAGPNVSVGNGTAVQIWDCHDNANQVFDYHF